MEPSDEDILIKRPIKLHIKKHRSSWASYRRWFTKSFYNEYWFTVDCSKPFLRLESLKNRIKYESEIAIRLRYLLWSTLY